MHTLLSVDPSPVIDAFSSGLTGSLVCVGGAFAVLAGAAFLRRLLGV